ncbi:MAG: chemotaxis protein CheW [Candidatus Eisenbacteria bacterium]
MSEFRGWCSFRVAGALFGVEVERVQEVVRNVAVTRVPPAPPAVAGLLNLRGRIVPVVDLRVLLGLPPADASQGGIHVIVRDGDDPVSLCADAIADVRRGDDIEVEPMPESFGPPHTELILGVVKLGDDMLLVLDLEAALDRAFAFQNTH